jgi:hypothetical protein
LLLVEKAQPWKLIAQVLQYSLKEHPQSETVDLLLKIEDTLIQLQFK